MNMAIQLKNKIKTKKYRLHTYEDDYDYYSNDIVEIAYHAYMSENFYIVSEKGFPFHFNIKDFVSNPVTNCQYDSFYMAFVSVFLTRFERDKLIKKIRGYK